ncbi:ribonuclease [Pseudomonas sp. ATCC PTA-122608]|uniref:ribonuclease T2 family protein n=1 Tax=unclassified Pseudomonas TaxID=196821 RepID=UPI00096BC65D|nr:MULTISPECIES: ribonuclease T2 [unclassified Pseudomonas]NIL17474.1 ribonuclease T2 [Pseudomonas sp. AN3A02]OLY73501.1 ribonuclease [Pseudomonas sp. ATCC PTA-122608]
MKIKAAWIVLWWVLASAATAAPRAQGQAGEFDLYVLSLSWSPTFCLTHPDDQQCSGKGYGFVLHGLWPQYAKGGWPASCAPQSRLSDADYARGKTLFPSPKLLKHEWAKHGTCSGLEASAYLDKTDAALGVVKIPQQLEPFNVPSGLAARDIEALFRESNPAMGNHGLAVICKGAVLTEVRVCLTKDLAFAGCPRSVKSQCRDGDIRIPTQR